MSGTNDRRLRSWLGALLLGSGLGCDLLAPPDAAAEAESPEHAHEDRSGTQWAQVQLPHDVTVLEAPATVRARAESHARIDVPLRATVLEVHAAAGDRVEVGDPIAEVSMPSLLEAAAVLAGTDDRLDTHRRRKDHLDKLQQAGLVGAGDVFELDRQLGELSAERRLALAAFGAAGIDPRKRGEVLRRGSVTLRAPVAGVVSHIDVGPGAVIEPGAHVATVLGRARVRVEVVSNEPLPRGLSLEFHGSDGTRLVLRPEPVATAVEPGLGRTLSWYETEDEAPRGDDLPGRVVLSGRPEGTVQVPRAALHLHQGRALVARRGAGPEHAVEEVEVEVLRSSGTSALVRSSVLQPGDAIAIDTATVLGLGRGDEETVEGHAH